MVEKEERATFISHGNTARLATTSGDVTLAKIFGTIAADEKRHETAYMKIVEKLFEIDPDGSIQAMASMMKKRITMPAHLRHDGRDNYFFDHYAAVAQRIGVYTVVDSEFFEFDFDFKVSCGIQRDDNGRRIWRRRTLTKKDDMLRYKLQRVPFVEEQVRKIKEVGKVMTMDIERLLLSEDNRFEFVNSVAAEATEYVERNRDEYGGTKKAIFYAVTTLWL